MMFPVNPVVCWCLFIFTPYTTISVAVTVWGR